MKRREWSRVVPGLIALCAAVVAFAAVGRVSSSEPTAGHRSGKQRPTELVKPAPKANPKAVIWRTAAPPQNPQAGDVWVNPKDGMAMVWVAPGKFMLGTSDAQIAAWLKEHPDQKREWFRSEQPNCRVNLSGYWIGRTEVTNDQYQRFVRATRQRAPNNWKNGRVPSGLTNSPVVFVAWQDARAYCEWAGGHLPTELQWEKAARGTDGRVFCWVNQWDKSRCCNAYSITKSGAVRVGSYRGDFSPYGCLDMAGNVSEWCTDWYDDHAYHRYAKGDLSLPKSGELRVLRGGSWSDLYPRDFRCASRDDLGPVSRYDSIGFRCARGASP
jgi:formylglycine-generating enzyme required for sulfatase activity